MILEIEGLDARSTLRSVIGKKLASGFRKRRLQPLAVRIDFADENGPRGGPDTRCGITVELPRRRKAVHVEHRAKNAGLAFDIAFEALERQLERERGRIMAKTRRPKKYFVAQRLLRPDESLETSGEELRPHRRSA